MPYDYNFVDGSLDRYRSDGWTPNGSLRVTDESAIGGVNTLVLHHYRMWGLESEKGFIVSPKFHVPTAINTQPSVLRGSYCSSGELERTGYIGAVSSTNTSNISSITYTVSGGRSASFTGTDSWLNSFNISPTMPYVSVDCDSEKKGAGSYYWLSEVHLRYAQ